MEEMKRIIARNIANLRKQNGMTQLDLAEKLNYSDKAISKWERGDSIPDIMVLKTLADLFGVTVDYLISEDHPEPALAAEVTDDIPQKRQHRFPFRVHAVVTGMSILLVWLIATLLFVIFAYALPDSLFGQLLPFIYAIPVSAIVWLTLNSIWFNRRRNYLIISLLMWSVLLAVFSTALAFGLTLWLIFVLGIPGQAIIFIWPSMKKRQEKADTQNQE